MSPRPGRCPRWLREFDRAATPEIPTRNSGSGGHPIRASTFPPHGETGVGPFPETRRAIFLDRAAAGRRLIPEKNPALDHFFRWTENQKLLRRRQIYRKAS